MRINKRLYLTIIFSISLIVILSALLQFSGNRLRWVDINTDFLTSHKGSRIIMHFSQTLPEAERLSVIIQPYAQVSHVVNGDSLIIEVNDILDYNQKYMVEVRGIDANSNDKAIRYEFLTSDMAYVFIDRNQNDDDRVVYKLGASEQVLFTHPRINSIQRLDDQIVAHCHGEESDELYIIGYSKIENIDIAGQWQFSRVRANPDGTLLVFNAIDISTPEDSWDESVMFYDIEQKVIFRLNGLDGKVLRANDYIFSPDNITLAVVTQNGDGLLINTENNEISVLGTTASILGFGDNDELYVDTSSNVEKIILSSLDREKITPTLYATLESSYGRFYPVLFGNEIISLITFYSYVDSSYIHSLAIHTDNEEIERRSYIARETSVLNVEGSSNGMYTFVETSEASQARYDDYLLNSKPENIQTEIIDNRNGDVFDVIDGFNVISIRPGY